MKLPGFSVGKKEKELFLSLLLYPDAVDAAAWEIGVKGETTIAGAVTQDLSTDTWEERNDAVDKCVSTLEVITKSENIRKVILGLPAEYVTDDGDVKQDVKHHIKKLTNLLELQPIGFVPIYQAIIHQYKQKEGVPPSLILMGITSQGVTISLYKVGVLIGQRQFNYVPSLIGPLEDALASFTDVEILPSRILVYGTDRTKLEEAKRQILEHHWQQKTNFLHFPKAEVLPGDGAAVAVSLAGSAELSQMMPMEVFEEAPVESNELSEQTTNIQEEQDSEPLDQKNDQNLLDQEDAITTEETIQDEVSDKESEPDHETFKSGGMLEEQTDTTLEQVIDRTEKVVEDEEENLETVDPDDFGFSDVSEETASVAQPSKKKSFALPAFVVTMKTTISSLIQQGIGNKKKTGKPSSKLLLPIAGIGGLLAVLIIGFILLTRVLPQANVSITVVPKTVETSEELTIDAEGTTGGTVVVANEREESFEGEKTITVTGKKTVGDPAKGSLVLYNKTTTPRTLKKGTVVSSGSLDFTLDSEVTIASASETFTGSTFGKTSTAVTAKDIGSKGNVAANKEFTVTGFSASVLSGRNEAAFSGGTSKDMTVVSRADQDNLVKELTQELIEKATASFSAADGEILIEDTIKTEVKQKNFSHEIGAEVSELKGTVSVLISGTAYKELDVKTVFRELLASQVSSGYKFIDDSVAVSMEAPVVAKSGAITVNTKGTAKLTPSFAVSDLVTSLAGKSLSEANELIKAIDGVGAVDIQITRSIQKDRLPRNPQRIKISISE